MEPKTEKQESEWWAQREKWTEEHYTETPHIDTYLVTVVFEVSFAQENDGVRNVSEAAEWLRHGDILQSHDAYTIAKVEKKGADE